MRRFGSEKKTWKPRFDRQPSMSRHLEKDPAKVDQAAVLNSFDKMTVKARPGEDADQLVRRFKRMVEQSGLLGELKKREFYVAPAAKRRNKKVKAKRRFMEAKAERDALDRDRE